MSKKGILHSDEYTLYKALFPKTATAIILNSNHEHFYEECKQRFPERFNFEILKNLFDTWISSGENNANSVIEILNLKNINFYINDSLIWKTDAIVQSVKFENKFFLTTSLKFSNDEFLYPELSKFQSLRKEIKRHRSDSWCLLEKKEYEGKFDNISKWARDFFNSEIETQFFYNFELERINFIFKKKGVEFGDKLNVTFEPGYPENDFVEVWQ
ncbi:hypothetical protein HK099_004217 [Clydaea vesicula]|uniref:Uncharacterized protein n=1 Tax=Clydaea vesicula TaxID=447962 RepID=A0AAD5U5A7_9FUNG|nr:hypothetical protein HK099_004217 [Clydaea vesicula]